MLYICNSYECAKLPSATKNRADCPVLISRFVIIVESPQIITFNNKQNGKNN
jgi:hypothetical protein